MHLYLGIDDAGSGAAVFARDPQGAIAALRVTGTRTDSATVAGMAPELAALFQGTAVLLAPPAEMD